MIAGVLRTWPAIARVFPIVARRNAVAAVFERQASFSNAAHAPNLTAGEFAIGMEAGARHREERAFLQRVLPSQKDCADLSAQESGRLISLLINAPERTFDLINDYLVPVAWQPLRRALGSASSTFETEEGRPLPKVVDELRILGAQLIIGSAATPSVRARAEEAADGLNRRVGSALRTLRAEWATKQPGNDAAILRNAVGFLWVAHPATVQAGALVMQELFGRPGELEKLASRAHALGDACWTDSDFRRFLSQHILELLRFRPPFPILKRQVPRDTLFDIGTPFPVRVAAGSEMVLLTIGALFDDKAVKNNRAATYEPGREFHSEPDRYLMFGMQERACIARYQVVEILVSALAGLLALPQLKWADPWFSRIKYDGPIISELRLSFADGR
ncbi:MAG TPA: hypothetical protein VJU53_15195 [Burkholderiaceae bacterium]|nr:hypothetical protein [Burkholderiaceae bacterium]